MDHGWFKIWRDLKGNRKYRFRVIFVRDMAVLFLGTAAHLHQPSSRHPRITQKKKLTKIEMRVRAQLNLAGQKMNTHE